MDYGNGIVITNDFVASDDSSRLIEWIDNNLDKFNQYTFQNNPKRHAIRFGKDQVFWDTSPHEIYGIDGVEDLARKYIRAVTLRLQYLYGQGPLYVNSFWLAKQESGASVKAHHDSHSGMNPQFTHSIICYLNDNEVGGELEFPELNISIKPPANSMVSFVSQGEELLHEVKEIHEDRYTMLFWITDNPDYQVKFHSDECPRR